MITSSSTSTCLDSISLSSSPSRSVSLPSRAVSPFLPLTDPPFIIKQEYPLAVLASLTPSHSILPPTSNTSNTLTSASQREADSTSLFPIVDPEIVRENPVEAKHRRLVRSHRNGPLDRELKPNAKIRDELNVSRDSVSRMIFRLSADH